GTDARSVSDAPDIPETGSSPDVATSPPPPELIWTRENAPLTLLRAIWGSGPGDIYAVGDGGVILHSSGDGTWKTQSSGTSANLYGLWGSGPNDVYVAVFSNVVLHSVGDGVWQHEGFPPGRTFNGVWGSGPDDVYAFGGGAYHATMSGVWPAT